MIEEFPAAEGDERSWHALRAEIRNLRAQLAALSDATDEGEAARSLSASLMLSALDATPALIAYVDRSRRYRFVNDTYREWFDLEPSQIVGQPIDSVIGPEAFAVLDAVLPRVFAGEHVTHENVLRFADGTRHETEANLIPQMRDGEVVGYFALVSDISGQREAERELRRSERRSRAFMELCPDAVYIVRDFAFLYMTPMAVEMFGAHDSDELIGSSVFPFIDADHHALLRERDARLTSGEPLPPQEYEIRRLDGVRAFIRSSAVYIEWQGEPAALVIAHDITSQRETAAALERARFEAEDARSRLFDAVENIPEAFAVFSPDERLEFFNSNFRDNLWRRVSDIIEPGVSLEAIVREHAAREHGKTISQEMIDQYVAMAMGRHRDRPSILEVRWQDGRWIRQSMHASDEGRTVVIYSDITDIKRREMQLAESEERYRQLVELTPDAVIVSVEGEIVFANASAARLFRAPSPSALIGRLRRELRIPGEEGRPEQRQERITRDRQDRPFEFQKRRRLDGTEVDVDVSVVHLTWHGRESVMTIMRDITERIRAQSALEESERRLSVAAANFPGAIYQRVLSPDGRITYPYVSHGIRDLLEYEPDEIAANPELMFDSVPVEDRSRLREAIMSSARDLTQYEFETDYYSRSGERIRLRSVARPRRHPDGTVVWDGVLLDLTGRAIGQDAARAAGATNGGAAPGRLDYLENAARDLRARLGEIAADARALRDHEFGRAPSARNRHAAMRIHATASEILTELDRLLARQEAGE